MNILVPVVQVILIGWNQKLGPFFPNSVHCRILIDEMRALHREQVLPERAQFSGASVVRIRVDKLGPSIHRLNTCRFVGVEPFLVFCATFAVVGIAEVCQLGVDERLSPLLVDDWLAVNKIYSNPTFELDLVQAAYQVSCHANLSECRALGIRDDIDVALSIHLREVLFEGLPQYAMEFHRICWIFRFISWL